MLANFMVTSTADSGAGTLREAITASVTNHVEIMAAVAGTVAPSAVNSAYALGGNTTVNDATGSAVVQAVIPGVTENDAKDLNDRIDGAQLGVPIGTAGGDLNGRVKYAAPGGTGITTVYVYLTHR